MYTFNVKRALVCALAAAALSGCQLLTAPAVEWSDHYKLAESKTMESRALAVDAQDNAYTVAKITRIQDNETLAVVRKMGPDGKLAAQKILTPEGDKLTEIKGAALDKNGHLVIVGHLRNHQKGFVIKFDKDLNVTWEKVWNTGATIFHNAIISDKDNSVYVTGAVKVNGSSVGGMVAVKFDGETGDELNNVEINRQAFEYKYSDAYEAVLVTDKNDKEWLYATYPAPVDHIEIMWWNAEDSIVDWTVEQWWNTPEANKNPVKLVDHPDGYILVGHRYHKTKTALSRLNYDENGFTSKTFEKLYVTAHNSWFTNMTLDAADKSVYLVAATPDDAPGTGGEQNALIAKYNPDCKTEFQNVCWVSRYNYALPLEANIDLRIFSWDLIKSYSYEAPSDVAVINDSVYMLVNSASTVAGIIDGQLSEMVQFDKSSGDLTRKMTLNNSWSYYLEESKVTKNAVFVSGENPRNLNSQDPDVYIYTRKIKNL